MSRTALTIVLSISLVIACYEAATTIGDMNCSLEKVGYTYPLDGPLTYYTCHDENTPILLRCVDGTGYINNGYIEGCVPWPLWECTSKEDKPVCTSDLQGRAFPSPTPNVYWQCSNTTTVVEVTCPDGQAFVSSPEVSGCQEWSVWLKYCPN